MLDDALGREVADLLQVLDEGFPAVHEMSGAEARAAVAARAAVVTNIDDVHSTEDRTVPLTDREGAGEIGVRVYHPHSDAPGRDGARPGVVFLHGGGFVFCDLESHDGFCRRIAKHTGAVVVSVDYRRAPEHRAPTAAEDAYAATCWTAEHAAELGIDARRIVVAGDSAGGNLAAVVALMARDRSGPELAGQVLLYPVIEPDFDSPSYQRYAEGHFNTRAAMEWYWTQYLGGHPASTPLPEPAAYVVPSRADLADLPPAVVVTAGRDPLSSEGEAYARALRGAGNAVRHRHYPDLFHGFVTIGPFRAAESARELLWADISALVARPEREEVSA